MLDSIIVWTLLLTLIPLLYWTITMPGSRRMVLYLTLIGLIVLTANSVSNNSVVSTSDLAHASSCVKSSLRATHFAASAQVKPILKADVRGIERMCSERNAVRAARLKAIFE